MKYKRNGDHYLHPIENLPKGLTKIEHKKNFVFGTGEASNHYHTIVSDRVDDFDIYQDEKGRYYFVVKTDDVKCGHFEGNSNKTADHETIPLQKKIYKQVLERELDFSTAIERNVID